MKKTKLLTLLAFLATSCCLLAYTGPGATKLTTIRQMIGDSANGSRSDVNYIVTGDSTRDSGWTQSQYWYSSQLKKLNISCYDNATAGLHIFTWVSNQEGFGDDSLIRGALNHIPGTGNNTILEYSLGINDYSYFQHEYAAVQGQPWPQWYDSTSDKIESLIRESMDKLLAAKPDLHIVLFVPQLVSDQRMYTCLKTVYTKIANDYDLPLFDLSEEFFSAGYQAAVDSGWYRDNFHLTEIATRRLIDLRLSKLIPAGTPNYTIYQDDQAYPTQIWNGEMAHWFSLHSSGFMVGTNYDNCLTSKFIPVNYGDKITFKGDVSVNSSYQIHLYNANKEHIAPELVYSYLFTPGISGWLQEKLEIVINSPDAAYLGITFVQSGDITTYDTSKISLVRTTGSFIPDSRLTNDNGNVALDENSWYFIKNVVTGRYLDSDGGGLVSLNPQMGSDSAIDQHWRFVQVSTGFYNIDNQLRGVLDSDGGSIVSCNNGVEPLQTSQDMQWEVEFIGNNIVRIKNQLFGRYYLYDAGDGRLRWNQGDTGTTAQWQLIPIQ